MGTQFSNFKHTLRDTRLSPVSLLGQMVPLLYRCLKPEVRA